MRGLIIGLIGGYALYLTYNLVYSGLAEQVDTLARFVAR